MTKRRVKVENKPLDIVSIKDDFIDPLDVTTQYVKLFNREVSQIFNVNHTSDDGIKSGLVHSKGIPGYVQKPQKNPYFTQDSDDEYDTSTGTLEYGTYWEAFEKQSFFHLLERYSIHRIDEWYPLFRGSKTKQEILVYYHVLKDGLNDVQNYKAVGLLKPEEFPIAYEVDDDFIEFEEHMADVLEKNISLEEFNNDLNQIYSKDIVRIKNLTVMKELRDKWKRFYSTSPIVSSMDTRECEQQLRILEQKNNDDISNADNDVKITNVGTDDSNVDDSHNVCSTEGDYTVRSRIIKMPYAPLNFTKEALQYFEHCIMQHTRDLIFHSVLPNIHERYFYGSDANRIFLINKNSNMSRFLHKRNRKPLYQPFKDGVLSMKIFTNHTSNHKPHVVKAKEIRNGIVSMMKAGKFVKTGSRGLLDSINKFQIPHDSRIRKAFSQKKTVISSLPDVIMEKLYQQRPILDIKNRPPLKYHKRTKIEKPLDIIYYEDLLRVKQRYKKQLRFPNGAYRTYPPLLVNDNEELYGVKNINEILNKRLDNEIELGLLAIETESLERNDQKKSRQYMDGLYHYFNLLANNHNNLDDTLKLKQNIYERKLEVIENNEDGEKRPSSYKIRKPSKGKITYLYLKRNNTPALNTEQSTNDNNPRPAHKKQITDNQSDTEDTDNTDDETGESDEDWPVNNTETNDPNYFYAEISNKLLTKFSTSNL